ncbi:MAG: trehalose-phosphatase [bacterium]
MYSIKDPIAEWPRIKKELRSRPVLLLMNYEGILVPAPPSPPNLDYNLRELLISLRSKSSVTTGIISSLKLSSLQNLVRINGMYYSGNSGLEIRGPEMEFIHPACAQCAAELQSMKASLQERFCDLGEISVEDNGFSLSLGYQQADNNQKEVVRERIGAVIQPFLSSGTLRLVEGKDGLEILPVVNWDKGRVVKMFENLVSSRKAHPLTIYLGADNADEDAFRAIRGKGIGILVGRKNTTSAGYCLSGHSEVVDFLLLLESFY